jgi:hypothetical protein
MTPAEREQWQQRQTAEFLSAVRVFAFFILPLLLIVLVVVSLAPAYLWLCGVVLGAASTLFGGVKFLRTPPGTLLPENTKRDGRPSARQHYLVCAIGGVLVVLISVWSGYVAL